MQFGSTQVTKVTAQFYYARHTIINSDVSSITPDRTFYGPAGNEAGDFFNITD